MKASEIRDMNPDEMQSKISDLREELFNLRFQHEIGQLENPQRMKQTKRDIARIETIIKEVSQNQKEDSE
ncbi:MAG: 50S ribosomal protein L29 [Desulfobacterales bacterium]|jgi:large subunit ribosomal protein L29|nr:50S ribosomal protein L29 [Desulfobacterales bacterium]